MQNKADVMQFYLIGYVQVFFYVFGWSLMLMWALQGIALSFGAQYDWAAVLSYLLLMLSFAVFYPSQRFWTYHRRGPDGQDYVIVGGKQHPG